MISSISRARFSCDCDASGLEWSSDGASGCSPSKTSIDYLCLHWQWAHVPRLIGLFGKNMPFQLKVLCENLRLFCSVNKCCVCFSFYGKTKRWDSVIPHRVLVNLPLHLFITTFQHHFYSQLNIYMNFKSRATMNIKISTMINFFLHFILKLCISLYL